MSTPASRQSPVSILMYHQVGHFATPRKHRAVYCDAGRFRAQMAFLKLFGYRVIALEEAWRGIFQGAPLPPRAVVLTFDDGYQNFAEHAWPVLRRHGFPAAVFLVSDLVGKHATWRDGDTAAAPLMDSATIRRLRREGVSFGSHTVSHCRLSRCDAPRQRAEIFQSKWALEQLLGEAVPDFCYPYGDYDERSRDLVAEAGYRTGLTCIRGAATFARSPHEIPRKAISYGDNLVGFWWKLALKNRRKDNSVHNPAHVIKGCGG